MKKNIYVVIILLSFVNIICPTEYYVDQNHVLASDSNIGNEELPFKTIQAGIDAAQVGDTIVIKGSTDSLSAEAVYEVSGNGITTKINGAKGNFIVVKSFSEHTVIIDGDGTGDGIELNNSYYEFDGLIFTNFNKATEGSAIKTNIVINNCEFSNTKETGLRLRNIDSLKILDSYVHNCYEAGISMRGCNNVLLNRVESSYNSDGQGASGDGDGFHTLDGDNINFIECKAISNSEDGFDITSNGLLENCISANHTSVNVKLWQREYDNYAPKTIKIVNMINYGAGEAGIKLSYGPKLYLANSVVYNNKEEGIAVRGISISEGPDTVESVILNNIIVGNGYGGIEVRQSGPSFNKVIADYNLYYNNGRGNIGFSFDDNFIEGDPEFVNADNEDFHLNSASMAINNGLTSDTYASKYSSLGMNLSLDLDGNERPKHSAWDIGPYETDISTGVDKNSSKLTSAYSLQNYPNPFNPTTNIQFTIPIASNIKLEIFNVIGERVALLLNEHQEAGKYKIKWDGKSDTGTNLSSGIYYYRLITKNKILTKKMMLIH